MLIFFRGAIHMKKWCKRDNSFNNCDFMEGKQVSIRKPAGFFPRVLAFLIDCSIFFIYGTLCLSIIAMQFFNLASGHRASSYRPWRKTLEDVLLSYEPSLLSHDGLSASFLAFLMIKWVFIIIIPFYFLYSVISDASVKQGTVGKTSMNLIVTDTHGRPIGLLRSSIRTLAKILCMIPLGIGFIPLVFPQKSCGLHDYASGTRVMTAETDSQNEAVIIYQSFL